MLKNFRYFQRFFGSIRQAGCQNDHPTLPTFLQLYHLLSVYKILRPPKFGNCRNLASICLDDRPKVTLEQFKLAFSNNDTESYKKKHLAELAQKLDNHIIQADWNIECDELIEVGLEMTADMLDCVIYYICGFVCNHMLKHVTCLRCREAFASVPVQSIFPIAKLVECRTRGGLIYANSKIFKLFNEVEKLFVKHINSGNVYHLVIEEILDSCIQGTTTITFPCDEHKNEVISYCINYYLTVRMRQYAKIHNRNLKGRSNKLKKQAKTSSY